MEYKEIKKVIESCHLNFLIGSGASRTFFETLSDIESQLTELESKKAKIIDDVYAVIDCSVKQYYFEKCIEGNSEIAKGGSSVLDDVQRNYDNLLSALDIILAKRMNNLVSKQVNLFTTNMDLFLDWSLEKQKLCYNDGFTGRLNAVFGTENYHNIIRKTSSHYDYQSEVPLFNLFKIHGSVNWKESVESINYDYDLNIIKEISSAKLGSSEVLTSIFEKIDKLKDLVIKGPIKRSLKHDKFLKAYDKLVMINPTKAKFETTTTDLKFYELLRMYSNHLERENSVLFVIGFSFADEHIREITRRVAAANPTLLIIIFAHDKGAKVDIDKKLHSYPNIKYVFDPTDSTKYTLGEINEKIFIQLSKELEKDYYK